ncbi:MAG: SH3 domain-containing protein [Prevotella sp.]|nr:SH3 domain-containing protein [Prevotella sp.]
MASRVCDECGRMIPDGVVTCPYCNSPVAPNNSSIGQHQNNNDYNNHEDTIVRLPKGSGQKWLYAILGLLSAALIGLGLWAWKEGLFSKVDKEEKDTTVVENVVPEQPEQPPQIYSNSYDGYVNIRKSPSAESAIVGEIVNDGPPATFISNSGKWYKVNYNGVVGYVKKEYVRVEYSNPSTPQAKSSKKVYYVVIDSFESLQMAKSSYTNMPDGLDSGDIYKAMSNGRVVYRIVVGTYDSRDEAQQNINNLKSLYGNRFWLWESDGPAQLVHRPAPDR